MGDVAHEEFLVAQCLARGLSGKSREKHAKEDRKYEDTAKDRPQGAVLDRRDRVCEVLRTAVWRISEYLLDAYDDRV